jgi:stearoyl-CoA desaturase (delta-9 desaturase)
VPQSILDEAARADHRATIAAAQGAAHRDYSYASLKKVVPAAAAIAVATASASQTALPKKAEDPAIHRDLTAQDGQPGVPPVAPR